MLEQLQESFFRKKEKSKNLNVLDNSNNKKIQDQFILNITNYLKSNYKGKYINITNDDKDSIILLNININEPTDNDYINYDKEILTLIKKLFNYPCLSKNGNFNTMIDMIVEYKNILFNVHCKFDRYYISIEPVFSKNLDNNLNYKYSDIKKLLSINSFADSYLIFYKDKFIIDVLTKTLDDSISKISNIFKDFDINVSRHIGVDTRLIVSLKKNLHENNLDIKSYNKIQEDLNMNEIYNLTNLKQLVNLAKESGLENLLIEKDIIKESNEVINSLDTINETVLTGDISLLPVYKVDNEVTESYYVDLDTLSTVSEVYDVELSEATNLIKEANKLDKNTDINVIIKEGFNKYFTLEEFYNIYNILKEQNINIALDAEILSEDFITEAGKISEFMNKVKDKIKTMNTNQLEKSIKQVKEMNKKLQNNLNEFEKMSKDEQKKIVTKEFVKDIVVYTGSLIGAGVGIELAPSALAFKPLLGYTLLGGSLITSWIPLMRLIQKGNKGKPSYVMTPKSYKRAIKNTINQNNALIKNYEYGLKEAKK